MTAVPKYFCPCVCLCVYTAVHVCVCVCVCVWGRLGREEIGIPLFVRAIRSYSCPHKTSNCLTDLTGLLTYFFYQAVCCHCTGTSYICRRTHTHISYIWPHIHLYMRHVKLSWRYLCRLILNILNHAETISNLTWNELSVEWRKSCYAWCPSAYTAFGHACTFSRTRLYSPKGSISCPDCFPSSAADGCRNCIAQTAVRVYRVEFTAPRWAFVGFSRNPKIWRPRQRLRKITLILIWLLLLPRENRGSVSLAASCVHFRKNL